jgi:mannose-6-phosphate isomerase-like protein (cupin superfamily)
MQKISQIQVLKPETHKKGWGEELWIVNNDKYCLKLLKFNLGSRFSLHMHLIKDESWFVLKGSLKLEYRDLTNGAKKEMVLKEGNALRVPASNPHRLTALEDSVIVEVSTTHYEEDSYRVEPGDSQKL